jgi:hypothetical protein
MNMTPTPRTDMMAEPTRYHNNPTVPASFARELERENVELRTSLQFACSQIEGLAAIHWTDTNDFKLFIRKCDALNGAKAILNKP